MTSTAQRFRRGIALILAVALIGAAMALSSAVWPLLAVPLVLAPSVAGRVGFIGVLGAASAVVAWGIGSDGLPAAPVAVGIGAFALTGVLVGARHLRGARGSTRGDSLPLRDPLTGLYSAVFFRDALARELARMGRDATDLSLILIDVDHFATFNERYGPSSGDALLRVVADIIGRAHGATDIATRIGGEEFAILMPGTVDHAADLAERIRGEVQRVEMPVPGGGRRDRRTVSAGVAAFMSGDAPGDLVERADRALSLAKTRGRNRVAVAADTAAHGQCAVLRSAV